MATGITDVGNISANIGTIIAESIIKFQRVNVMWNLMRNKQTPKGSGTVQFPIITIPTKSDVASLASGAEETDAVITKVTSSSVSIEVLRKAVAIGMTDLADASSTEDMIALSSSAVANALSQQFDSDAVTLASSLSTSAGSDTKNITLDMLFEAVKLLKTANAPTFGNGKYACVLSPKQVWGAYGISNFLGNILAPNEKASEIVGTGFVTSIAGLDIYWSSEVVEGSDIAHGMVISPECLGVGWRDMRGNGSFIDVELSRDALAASSVIVGNGYFAVAELVDSYGVELQTLVTEES